MTLPDGIIPRPSPLWHVVESQVVGRAAATLTYQANACRRLRRHPCPVAEAVDARSADAELLSHRGDRLGAEGVQNIKDAYLERWTTNGLPRVWSTACGAPLARRNPLLLARR